MSGSQGNPETPEGIASRKGRRIRKRLKILPSLESSGRRVPAGSSGGSHAPCLSRPIRMPVRRGEVPAATRQAAKDSGRAAPAAGKARPNDRRSAVRARDARTEGSSPGPAAIRRMLPEMRADSREPPGDSPSLPQGGPLDYSGPNWTRDDSKESCPKESLSIRELFTTFHNLPAPSRKEVMGINFRSGPVTWRL